MFGRQMIPTGTNLEVKNIPKVTITLIVANAVAFIWEPLLIDLLGERIIFLTYGTGNVSLIGLFTSFFLHADLLHIIFNMLFLWVFGPPLEDRVGRKLFLVYYLACGVAANLFDVIVTFIHDPASDSVGIGASGAISGIMGLYLYRCYYSKIKMVVSPIFLPMNIQIPAALLLIFWFFKNVFYGYAAFSKPSNIANWAHVGGFLFGLAVGRIMKYGHEGAMEHYTSKVLEKIRDGRGWKEADTEEELLKLLKLNPDDPDKHLEMGHFYRENMRNEEAVGYYQTAIHKLLLTNPLHAAYALLDYLIAFGKPISPQHHLKAAEALVGNHDLEEALKVIMPVVTVTEPKVVGERLQLIYIKLCKALGKEELDDAVTRFDHQYPGSKYRQEVEEALKMRSEEVFPLKTAPIARRERTPELEEQGREGKILFVFHNLINVIVDPFFLLIWFFIMFGLFAAVSKKLMVVQILSFSMAYIISAIFRIDWLHLWKELTIDENTARLAADTSTQYNRAWLAERGENYSKAAELYENVLFHDTSNIQARFNLARIYLEKLNDRNNGLRQLQQLMKAVAKEHPYYEYAVQELKFGKNAKVMYQTRSSQI